MTTAPLPSSTAAPADTSPLPADVVAAGDCMQVALNFAEISPENFTVLLLRAVTAESVSFSTFALMVAASTPDLPSLAGCAIRLGYSYHAVHKMIERCHYFEKVQLALVSIRLSPEGKLKMARISRRIARYSKETAAPLEP